MEHTETPEKQRNPEAGVNRRLFGWRPGWIILAVTAALVVAGGAVIPGLLNRSAPESERSSSTPLALPTFTPLQDPGTSFTNGARKLWELDLVAAFPDYKEPRICYDWSKTPQHDGNTLRGGPLDDGPLVIGDVWVVWVVDNRMCDATDLGANGSRLAGVSAGTGEVVWSLDADSKWSCDTLPSAPRIICTDLAGTIFTLDEAGTRSDLITFPRESAGEDGGSTEPGRVASWADGVVVVIPGGKGNGAHLLGLDGTGGEVWRDELPGGYSLGWEVGYLGVTGDVFTIWEYSNDAGTERKEPTEKLRSARNGEVLATRENPVTSPYPIHVGPRTLDGRSNPSLAEAGEGSFEIVDTSKTDYEYVSWPDGVGILIRAGEEGAASPEGRWTKRRNLSLCNEQTASSCRTVPGLEGISGKAYGVRWPRLVNVDGKAHVMTSFKNEEETPNLGYAVAPVDFSHEASKGEFGFTIGDEEVMGVSDGFNSIVVGKRSSDEVRGQYVGSGDVVDISVGDGGDWYPVPRMPGNRILLGRSEKVGEVRGETHLAAWGPA